MQEFISEDEAKGLVSIGTGLVTVVDQLLNGFGGLGKVLLAVYVGWVALNAIQSTNIATTIKSAFVNTNASISLIKEATATAAQTSANCFKDRSY